MCISWYFHCGNLKEFVSLLISLHRLVSLYFNRNPTISTYPNAIANFCHMFSHLSLDRPLLCTYNYKNGHFFGNIKQQKVTQISVIRVNKLFQSL